MISRKVLFILITIPILSFAAAYAILRQPTIDFLSDGLFHGELLDEPQKAGLSSSFLTVKDNEIDFSFLLSDKTSHPYAGWRISRKDNKLFSLRGYKLEMEITCDNNLPLVIRINKYIKGYTNTNNWQTYLLSSKTENVSKGENHIKIKAEEIDEIPNWWYSINKSWINKEIDSDKSNISEISFICENGAPIGSSTHLKIEKIRLTYDASALYPYLYLAIPYYVIVTLLFLSKKNGKVKYVFMPIKEIEAREKIQTKTADILAFIGENYPNPDLKINDVAKHFHLTETETTNLIKEYCDKSFRQYLNQIRMEEAKRLLKETNQQISIIAFGVGYNNIQHFNRVFKEYAGVPPTLFRSEEGEASINEELEHTKEAGQNS